MFGYVFRARMHGNLEARRFAEAALDGASASGASIRFLMFTFSFHFPHAVYQPYGCVYFV